MKRTRGFFAILTIFLLAFAVAALSQVRAPTLRDEVRKKGAVWHVLLAHYSRTLVTLEDLINGSCLIIRGRVVDESTRLSPSEHSVLTDYTIEVLEVFKDPEQLASAGDRIVVIKGGGNLSLEGKPVRVHTPLFPPIPWVAPHVFFVGCYQSPNAPGKYGFAGVQLGVFRIEKGKMIAHAHGKINHPIIREFHNMGEEEFLQVLKGKITALEEAEAAAP